MTQPIFTIKAGDDEPALVLVLKGTDGLPVDLTDVTEVKLGLHKSCESLPSLEVVGEVVAPDDQASDDPERGQVRFEWGTEDTRDLGAGEFEAEVQVTRDGHKTTFPSEGYFLVRIIRDIVDPEES